ncbi:hypothetical protein [Nocardia sp. XZ_19_385]|uniref:hypothetical protein n=1 Tax=Nocardia sp. XZ_19_385 TaxID=2769488 RepID=UPI0018905B38|nr:hypothetical protein [Nocardia sp. XZ_19_385]
MGDGDGDGDVVRLVATPELLGGNAIWVVAMVSVAVVAASQVIGSGRATHTTTPTTAISAPSTDQAQPERK